MASFTSDLDFEAMEPHKGRQAERVPHHVLSASELALLASAKMRCGGCGSKVGAASLGAVLQRLRHELLVPDDVGGGGTAAAASALLGLDQPDDAAVVDAPPPGHKLVGCQPAPLFTLARPASPHDLAQVSSQRPLAIAAAGSHCGFLPGHDRRPVRLWPDRSQPCAERLLCHGWAHLA